MACGTVHFPVISKFLPQELLLSSAKFLFRLDVASAEGARGDLEEANFSVP